MKFENLLSRHGGLACDNVQPIGNVTQRLFSTHTESTDLTVYKPPIERVVGVDTLTAVIRCQRKCSKIGDIAGCHAHARVTNQYRKLRVPTNTNKLSAH